MVESLSMAPVPKPAFSKCPNCLNITFDDRRKSCISCEYDQAQDPNYGSNDNRDVIELIPSGFEWLCPQCGGIEQCAHIPSTPDLTCQSCGANYKNGGAVGF